MKEKLIIEVVVGFMYKVQKNGLNVSMFKKEFAAIRHGDYFDFFNLIGEQVDFLVTYDNGKISMEKDVLEEDIAFVALTKAGPSLRNFYCRCLNEYGSFSDLNLEDVDFERAALFELSLRMHANGKRLSHKRTTFEKVIESLSLTDSEKEVLHEGRRFINNIKRPDNLKVPWCQNIERFNKAYQLMVSKQLTIT